MSYRIKKLANKESLLVHMEKELKRKLMYLSYRLEKSQNHIIIDALEPHIEKLLKDNPGYEI